MNSVTTRPAPNSLQIRRRAGSETPAIGARKALLGKLGRGRGDMGI